MYRRYIPVLGVYLLFRRRDMKCPNCGRTWNFPNMFTSVACVCPYCTETVDGNGRGVNNLGEIMERIIGLYGEEVLDNPLRLNALLMDFAPDMAKERKLVVNSLKEGILAQLRRGIEEPDLAEIVLRQCTVRLATELWITENAAQYAVNVILRSIGYQAADAVWSVFEEASPESSPMRSSFPSENSVSRGESLFSGQTGYAEETATNRRGQSERTATNQKGQSGRTASTQKGQSEGTASARRGRSGRTASTQKGQSEGTASTQKGQSGRTASNQRGQSGRTASDRTGQSAASAASGGKQLVKGTFSFGPVVRREALLPYESIGYKAFAADTHLTEVEIPETVTRIYPKAFLNCTGLRKVSLGHRLEAIGRGAFDGCIRLETITVGQNPNYIVMDGLLIDKREKKLIRSLNGAAPVVSVANGIAVICKKAFEKTSVECVKLPGTVMKTEEDAFFCTMKLREIRVDSTNAHFSSIDGALYSRDRTLLIRYPQGKQSSSFFLEDNVRKIARKAFSCAVNLTGITFAHNLKKIGSNAFEYCTGLERIVLPMSVEVIGDRAFQYCEGLSSVMLPQGIVWIGDCAFLECSALETVSIPRSVSGIGNMAFAGCRGLRHVLIQENIRFIGDRAFWDCPYVEVSIRDNEYALMYCMMHGVKYRKI